MSRIERGQANPSLDILLSLSAALDTTPDYFLTDTEHSSAAYLNSEIADKLQQCSTHTLRIVNQIIDILLREQDTPTK